MQIEIKKEVLKKKCEEIIRKVEECHKKLIETCVKDKLIKKYTPEPVKPHRSILDKLLMKPLPEQEPVATLSEEELKGLLTDEKIYEEALEEVKRGIGDMVSGELATVD